MASHPVFVTLGMFIIDQFEYLDEEGNPTERPSKNEVCFFPISAYPDILFDSNSFQPNRLVVVEHTPWLALALG